MSWALGTGKAGTPQVWGFSQKGTRKEQQDNYGFCVPSPEKGLLAVVADGMGGLSNGAELSALAVSTLLEHFQSTPVAHSPEVELCDLCAQAVRAVSEYLVPYGKGTGGTTLVACILRGNQLSFFSVGDSRAALVRGGGLLWLNRPHWYSQQLLEEAAGGTLDLSQALRDPQRGALASYLGSGDALRVDFSPEPVGLLRGDRVLLMTDGISGVLSQEEIGAAAKGSCRQIAQRLERAVLAKANPSQDNFTAIVAAYGR